MADENASPADKPPSRFARLFTRFVLLPCAALFVWGVVNYNLTSAVHPQFWSDIAARLHGPMTF
ncbi:MAG TPA: hypothetical protein VI168_04620, partial [Croceibacterium sp.]